MKTIEVVINDCFGGFSLSDEAILRYAELKNNGEDKYFSDRDIPRDDKTLIKVIRELGVKANGMCADLKILEIPENVKWHISEYDGNEHIAEDHRTWS